MIRVCKMCNKPFSSKGINASMEFCPKCFAEEQKRKKLRPKPIINNDRT